MYKHGKKIDKTRKFTYDEIRQVSRQYLDDCTKQLRESIMELNVMAFRDFVSEHCPGMNVSDAIVEFEGLVSKYAEDMASKEFTLAELKKYNRSVG